MGIRLTKDTLNGTWWIRTLDRREYLTAGAPDNRVVRWSLDSQHWQRSRWFISPMHSDVALNDPRNLNLGTPRYRLQNLSTGGFMHFGSGYYWVRSGDNATIDEKTFEFELTDKFFDNQVYPGAKCVEIVEFTKGENVGIGSNGWAVRWSKTNGDEQAFFLEWVPDPNPLPDPTPVSGNAPRKPSPPTDLFAPPDLPSAELIGEVVLPSAAVHDSRYTDPIAQFNTHRYYRLQHWQSYALADGKGPADMVVDPYSERTFTTTFRYLFQKSALQGISDTFTWSLSGELTAEIQEGTKKSSGKGGAKLAATISRSISAYAEARENYDMETVESTVFKYPVNKTGETYRVIIYGLRNTYKLLDPTGYEVATWNLWDKDTELNLSWPANVPKETRERPDKV